MTGGPYLANGSYSYRASNDPVNWLEVGCSNSPPADVVWRILCTQKAGRCASEAVKRRIVAMKELWTGNWDVGGWSMLGPRSRKKDQLPGPPGCRSAGELQSRDRLRKRHPPGPQLEGGEGKDEDERFHRHLEHDD